VLLIIASSGVWFRITLEWVECTVCGGCVYYLFVLVSCPLIYTAAECRLSAQPPLRLSTLLPVTIYRSALALSSRAPFCSWQSSVLWLVGTFRDAAVEVGGGRETWCCAVQRGSTDAFNHRVGPGAPVIRSTHGRPGPLHEHRASGVPYMNTAARLPFLPYAAGRGHWSGRTRWRPYNTGRCVSRPCEVWISLVVVIGDSSVVGLQVLRVGVCFYSRMFSERCLNTSVRVFEGSVVGVC